MKGLKCADDLCELCKIAVDKYDYSFNTPLIKNIISSAVRSVLDDAYACGYIRDRAVNIWVDTVSDKMGIASLNLLKHGDVYLEDWIYSVWDNRRF